MPVTFQRIQIFVVLLLLVRCPIAARASEPITVIYGRGRESHMQSYRNGQQALKDATAACKLMDWKDENMIDTLAMAYAEADFDSAVRWRRKP